MMKNTRAAGLLAAAMFLIAAPAAADPVMRDGKFPTNGINIPGEVPAVPSPGDTQAYEPWWRDMAYPPAVTAKPKAAALTLAGCTVGVASATCLAASLVTTHLQIQNVSATATIACTFGGTAALNASNSFILTPYQSANWGGATSLAPTALLACIASAAATPLYVEYN